MALRNMTLIQRFSLLCLLALASLSAILGWVIGTSIEHDMLSRSREIIAKSISQLAKNHFQGVDFSTPKTGLDYDDFAERMKHLPLGTNTKRMTIWNKGHTIIWSNDKQIVGKAYPEDEELNEAIGGRVVSKIIPREKFIHKYKFDSQSERLLEIYVPIRLEAGGEIAAIVESYQNLDPLFEDISYHKRILWASIIPGFAVLYFALFGIVCRASRHIEAQTKDIIRSEERYRSLVRSAQDGIISINGGGEVALFNEAAERMFGYSAEEVIGRPLTMIMPEEYREKYKTAMRRFSERGEITDSGKTMELEGLRRSGERFPIELSLSVSGEGDDRIVTGIVRDISERKKMQGQLIEAERQASVSLIAGSIGHELNNAISGLMGYADLLRMDPGNEKVAEECAEIFGTQSQRLRLHAHNLLALSKPREPEIKPVALNSLLDRVTEMLYVSGLLKRYSIVKEYSGDLPPVMGDETLLEQVVRNLEINAAHAMENQGILRLSTRFSGANSHVEFSIADTGHGIADDRRRQIFLPFYTTKGKGKGTGLGMYIVKQIVEQHEGYIRVESEVGVGTSMTVGLPAAKG